MATPFPFELVSPEKLLLSGEATAAMIPSVNGYFTMMANHSPVMALLKAGVVKVTMADGSQMELFVRGGYADISVEGCIILAEYAVPIAELSADVIEKGLQDAREDVADAKDDEAKKKAEAKLAELLEAREALKH